MKTLVAIALAASLAACAGVTPRPDAGPVHERWFGYVQHHGLYTPVTLELTATGGGWNGSIGKGADAVALQGVRVEGSEIHFQAIEGSVFEGTVAKGTMAGTVNGPLQGSFALQKIDERELWDPYPNGP